MMKIYVKLTLFALLVFHGLLLNGQGFPIETRILLQPPYPLNLDAYEEFLNDGLLEINNTTSSALDIYFEVELQEESGILNVLSNGSLSTPYTAQPGVSILSVIEIQEVFAGITWENFTIGGLTQEQQNAFLLNRQIPEGSYRLCIRAFNEIQQSLSDPSADGCHEFELLFPERPIIDIPYDEEVVDTLGLLNITWSHFLSDPLIRDRTEYVLKIIDITEQNILNIQNDMTNPGISPEYEENEGNTRFKLIQDGVDLPLTPGHQYGLRVTAMDPDGETSYGFGGHSEIVTFQYGEAPEVADEDGGVLSSVEILSPENAGFIDPDVLQIPLSWQHEFDNEDLEPFLTYRFKLIDMDTLKITSIQQSDFEEDRYDYVYDAPITANDTVIVSNITNELRKDHQYALIMWVESSDDRFTFENDGYSEIVTFILGEEPKEEELEDGCGGECLETLPKDRKEVAIRANETYFLGKHMLTVDQVVKDQVNGGYEGKGFITLNFLQSIKVNVEFEGLSANKAKRVFAGEANAVFDQGVTPSDGLVGFAAASTVDVDYEKAKNLANALRSGGKLVSALAGQKTSLPLGFDRDVDGDKMIIGITEMNLTPTKAVLTAMFSMDNPDWGEYVPAFAASNICFTRSGFGSVVKLNLAKDFTIPLTNEQLVLKASTSGQATEKGTYCILDCNGFKEGQITAEIGLPREMLVPELPDGSVDPQGFAKLTLSGVFRKANDFMMSASITPCQIPGLEGFSFEMQNGYYDFSDRMNPEGIVFPQGYQRKATDKLWKGVWFSNVTIRAPQDWGFAEGEERTSASLRNFIKDDVGVSIVGTVNNLVGIDKGSIEGFAASIDQLKLNIIRGEFKNVSMTGRLGLPILPEGKYLDYEGIVDRASKSANEPATQPGSNASPSTVEPLSMSFVVKPDKEGYDIDWLKAHIDFDETSQFTLTKNKKEQGFSAILSGVIKVQSSSIDAANASRDTGAPEIEIPGLKFEGMEISRMTTLSGNTTAGAKSPTDANKKASPFKFVGPTFSFQGASFANLSGNSNPGAGGTGTGTSPAAEAEEEDSSPAKMNGFTMSIDHVGITFGEDGSSQETASVESGTQVNLSVTPTVMLVGGQNKTAKSGSAKKEKGFAISASGSFTIQSMVVKKSNAMSFEYKDIRLDSFAIAGDIGPIKIDGKLGFYQNDDKFGNGAVASLGVELPLMDIGMQARFGTMMNSQGEKDYSYWYFFANASKEMKPGNLPLVKAGAYFSLYGFKGGAYYHMNDANPKANAAEDRYVPDKNISLGLSAGIRFSVTEPNVLWADAEFGIQFKDDASLDKVTLKGEAYMLQTPQKPMPGSEIDGIKVLLVAQLNVKEIDNETRVTFDAECDIYANIGNGLMVGNMNSSKPNLIVESTMHISDSQFSILAGSPSKPGSVRVGIPDLASITAQAYFMAGKDVEFEKATLDPFISNLLGKYNPGFTGSASANQVSTRKADGFAVGIKVDYKLDIQASILYANFRAMFGFDLSMTNADKGKVCSNNENKPLGMGGYYAQGRVYAGLSGDMGLDVDLFFYEGKVSLAQLQAALLLEGGMPNPIWARGTASISYSVLGGLLEGTTGFQVQIGEECVKQDIDPFSGSDLIADIDPGNNQTNVSVFAKPRVSLNAELGVYKVPFNKDGVTTTREFRLKITSYVLRETGKGVVSTYQNVKNSTTILLEPRKMLSPSAWHTVSITLKADEKINGIWTPYKKDGSEWTVTAERKFRTGLPPNRVVWENVNLTYPFTLAEAYIHGENAAKEGFIEMGVSTDYLFKSETPANRQWHSKIVAKFYTVDAYSRKIYLETTQVLQKTGKYFVFKMPNSLPKENTIALQIVREYYQNSNYDLEGKDVGPIANKDYTINLKGKTYKNYSNTKPKDIELCYYEFKTSAFNTFADKVRSPSNKVRDEWNSGWRQHNNIDVYRSGRNMIYRLGGSEGFTYEEIGKRRIIVGGKVNRGIVEYTEDYYSPFYSDVFKFHDFIREVMKFPSYDPYFIYFLGAATKYGLNKEASIDNYPPIDPGNRQLGFKPSAGSGLFYAASISNSRDYEIVSSVLYYADADAQRAREYAFIIAKHWPSTYVNKLMTGIGMYKSESTTRIDPKGQIHKIRMKYWVPRVVNGTLKEYNRGTTTATFKY